MEDYNVPVKRIYVEKQGRIDVPKSTAHTYPVHKRIALSAHAWQNSEVKKQHYHQLAPISHEQIATN